MPGAADENDLGDMEMASGEVNLEGLTTAEADRRLKE
jgi:hypothetical protein